MSKTKLGFALHKVTYTDPNTGKQASVTAEAAEFSEEDYEYLKGREAIRDLTEAEQALWDKYHSVPAAKAASEPAKAVADEPALKAKHKGAGKYVVVNASDEVVSGEDVFDGKEAAEAWIAAQADEGLL